VSAWPAIVLGAGLLLDAGALVAHAESRYVADQASVTVSASPDGSGERIAEVASGEQVDVLEREEDRVHIRLASGRDGWVKASDLTADPPLRLQLAGRTHELEERTHALDQARQQLAVLQAELERARAAVPPASTAPSVAAAAGATPPASAARPAPGALEATLAAEPARNGASWFATQGEWPREARWSWLLIAAVLALFAGIALGWRLLDRRIRRRYGGLRIY
jgi:SH3 domain protein